MVYNRIQKINQAQMGIIDQTIDYVRKVHSAILVLAEMIDNLIDKKSQSFEDKVKEISKFEQEGENMKHELLDELSKRDVFFRRGDFMRLIITLNQIMDKIEGTAFRVERFSKWNIESGVGGSIKNIVALLIKQLGTLKEMVFTLTQSTSETLKKVQIVYELEQDIDKIRRELLERLFNLDIDYKTFIKTRDLLDGLEDIANLAEHVADATRIIAVARRGAP